MRLQNPVSIVPSSVQSPPRSREPRQDMQAVLSLPNRGDVYKGSRVSVTMLSMFSDPFRFRLEGIRSIASAGAESDWTGWLP